MNRKSKHRILGAFLGTIVEYYDYSLYGFSASVIARKFFPQSDHLTSLINVFAIYAVAYFSKPLGALIFGIIGDSYGRKKVLNITIIGIVLPTMIIGILPDYSVIGNYSIWVLVFCRFMQGIFVGGEYDGAAIYVIEHLGEKYRYTASAITRTTGVLGILLGIGVTNFFNSHPFSYWGWRIPFLLSFPLALIALLFRRYLYETPEFRKIQNRNIKIFNFSDLLKEHWRLVIMVIFVSGGFGATYQIAIIFMKQYLPIIIPQSSFIISTFSILIVLCFAFTMPISGFLADKFGIIYILRAALITAIIASILFVLGISFGMLNLVLTSSVILSCCVAPINALAHGVFVKVFAVNKRYRAISLGHSIGTMLMGGTASYVCLLTMKYSGFLLFPLVYLILFKILAFYIISRFLLG